MQLPRIWQNTSEHYDCLVTLIRATALTPGVSNRGFPQKVDSAESAFSGRLKIAQRFIAGIGRNRDVVREADG